MRKTIQSYIEDSFLVEIGDQVTADTDLFEAQIIDSFGLVELVTFLETTFDLTLTDEDLLSQRLTTLNGIVGLVEERALAAGRS